MLNYRETCTENDEYWKEAHWISFFSFFEHEEIQNSSFNVESHPYNVLRDKGCERMPINFENYYETLWTLRWHSQT